MLENLLQGLPPIRKHLVKVGTIIHILQQNDPVLMQTCHKQY